MRDLIIAATYVIVALGTILYGICLVIKPKRFSTWITRPRFARSSSWQEEEWDESENKKWRRSGFAIAILGLLLFLAPLHSVILPSGTFDRHSNATAHLHDRSDWESYIVWFLILILGSLLVIKPRGVLDYFRPKHSTLSAESPVDLGGPKVVGVVVILLALWGIFQVFRH